MNTTHTLSEDFIKAWRTIERTLSRIQTRYPTVGDVTSIITSIPAPRYYISLRYARRMLKKARANSPSHQSPKAKALLHHVELISSAMGISRSQALRIAIRSPAPSFFITPASARTLFYRRLNQK